MMVLGGGMAGIAAAWRLSEAGWRERFSSITVVERSFRLGGKGASSRGPHGRIEEHGLHVWLGHYDNAFRLIRDCYAELDRARTDPSCPIRTWRDAFIPANDLGLFDIDSSGWLPWIARFSGNTLLPGDAGSDAGGLFGPDLLVRSALLIRDFYASLRFDAAQRGTVTLAASPHPPRTPRSSPAVRALASTLLAASNQLLQLASHGAQRLAGPAGAAAVDATLAPLLARLAPLIRVDPNARRLHELVDLVRAVLGGMIADQLYDDRQAYDAINHLEFKDWLIRHRVQPTTLQSAIVRGQYDLVFSLEDGDPARPRFAAGWGLFLSAKLWLDYKGSIFWRTRAGMGDVVFAPLYQSLVARGVQFRFMTPVVELVPSRDGSSINSITVGRTIPLAPGVQQYNPLTTVKGLPCFPSEPDWRQLRVLQPGAARHSSSPPSLGAMAEVEELCYGRDFELLVLAMPPAAARRACTRLMDQRSDWRAMVDNIGSVSTHAFQLWLKPAEAALGWAHPGTTMSAFAKPFDTWASVSHVAEFEEWTETEPPRTVAYFCSTLPPEAGTGRDAGDYTHDQAIGFLRRHSSAFWPHATDPDTGDFRWDLLCGQSDALGQERFDTQYWTANTDPSDQYVQSLPGTDRFRMRPDSSGYRNLVLAGDWTDCGINAGCIEAAVVSGLQAGNALLGRSRWERVSGSLLR